jgi:hypothetical protein
MIAPDFSAVSDADLADWHRAINPMWLAIQTELAKRRRALREAQDRARCGWPEYRKPEELVRQDAEVGGASADAFK